jgi:hypothetical protein
MIKMNASLFNKDGFPQVHGLLAKTTISERIRSTLPFQAFDDTRPTYSRDASDEYSTSQGSESTFMS